MKKYMLIMLAILMLMGLMFAGYAGASDWDGGPGPYCIKIWDQFYRVWYWVCQG